MRSNYIFNFIIRGLFLQTLINQYVRTNAGERICLFYLFDCLISMYSTSLFV